MTIKEQIEAVKASNATAIKDVHRAPGLPQVIATLYMGNNIPGAGDGEQYADAQVTFEDFARFLRDSVTPKFPGFTVANVQGYWQGKPEAARVLTILGDDTDALRHNVRVIAEQYKTDFAQEAVIYSFQSAAIAWNCWPHGPVHAYHRPGKGY